MNYPNIYSLFVDRVRRFGSGDSHPRDVFYVRRDDQWEGISWDRFDDETHAFATALLSLGLKKGGSVAILMGNVPEWPISDIGTIAAGGVGVGLYPTSSAQQCQYIINHSDAEFILVDTLAQLEKVLSIRTALPKVKTVVVLDKTAVSKVDQVISYEELIGRGIKARGDFSTMLRGRAETAKPEDIAIMVYTSGTTGRPKGALLSHRYIINSVESLRQTVPIFDSDVSFSYLPYCHVAERISGLYNRLYAGAPAYFVDDLSKLGQYMLEVRPTVFASLPRFFEKIHARAMADIAAAPKKQQEDFTAALALGREISRMRQAGKTVPAKRLRQYDVEAAPLLKKVKNYFGGRIRLATSGGAPLPLEVAEFFDAAGLPILQAYGLTENICVAFNRADNHKFGTVGPPMPGCEVKLAADGEILIRSRMMFSGYYKAPEETEKMFCDGWLLTGDIGELDDQGFLKITGRKKELIVTSTGKNISPALIENLLKEHHLISHALVYGEGKSYLVALITLNQIEATEYARAHDVRGDNNRLGQSDPIRRLVQKIVEGVNARLSSTESIRRFALLDRDFELEKDEVTPTGKLKREVVSKRYRNLIESLYAETSSSTSL
jgi:long-chain acyl-CoA synthetase